MRPWLLILAAVASLCLGCSIPHDPSTPAPAEVRFSPQDRQRIVDFYAAYEFPPAVADPAIIAGDLATRLETTAKVPPDIAGVPLPVELEHTLTPLPPGYVRFRAGNSVVLMDARIWQVIDQVAVEFR